MAGYEQKEATGTSLAAIIVIGALAAIAQAFYGNVRLKDGLLVGVLVGVVVANAVPERGLELSFAAVQLLFAWQLAKKAGLR